MKLQHPISALSSIAATRGHVPTIGSVRFAVAYFAEDEQRISTRQFTLGWLQPFSTDDGQIIHQEWKRAGSLDAAGKRRSPRLAPFQDKSEKIHDLFQRAFGWFFRVNCNNGPLPK